MKLVDSAAFCVQSLASQRLRTLLIVLAMTIGIAGVVLLTWLGEAARSYVVGQFNALGTNLVSLRRRCSARRRAT